MDAALDLLYLRFACRVAQKQSHDEHTQNGAVLVAPDEDYVLSAANGFPPRVAHNEDRLARPLKYSYIEHAERAVIYKAAKYGVATKGATLYCPWFACTDCARAIILAGITEVVGLAHGPAHGAWQESIERADQMFTEAGVQFRRLAETMGIKLLRDGKVIEI